MQVTAVPQGAADVAMKRKSSSSHAVCTGFGDELHDTSQAPDKDLHAAGFCNEVHGPAFESLNLVPDQAAPGQKDHRQLDAAPPDRGQQVSAGHLGQEPIEDNDMGDKGSIECPEQAAPICEMPDAEAAFRQFRDQRVGVFFVVLDKENADGQPVGALPIGYR
jgi:hypothetical protein